MGTRHLFIAVGIMLAVAGGRLYAQSVQLVYTQAGLTQALAIKSALNGMKTEVWPAASLINISGERQGAYVAKIAALDAVVIIGEDAMKAAAGIAFPVPVVIVNAIGDTAGKSAVIRVLDAGFSGAGAAKDLSAVGDSGATKTSRNLILKCQGIPAGAAVKKVITDLAR